jgi:hypothetical protein
MVASCLAGDPDTPNPIYPAASLLIPVNTTTNGKMFKVDSNGVKLKVLHAYGSAEEMGRAQGQLLGAEAHQFLTEAIPEFYASELSQMNLTKLPAWLQKAIVGKAGADAINGLLATIYVLEEKYIKQSRSDPIAEMTGFAEGICESGEVEDCKVDELVKQIKHINMIPELIRMTCSMFGAFGPATKSGKLLQLRALDFGDGPFANYTLITTRHPADGNPFVSVAFPGMIAAITGFSTKVGISEKVWETYDNPDVQPGKYDGEPDAMVLRDILQFSDSIEDAIGFTQSITRTWAIFIGLGDFASQTFNAVGYRAKDLQVFDAQNISQVTHQEVIENVVYIDKHPQPSHDNHTMPALMKQYYGELDGPTCASYIPRKMQSGDLHIGIYDFGARKAWFATGAVNSEGRYGDDDTTGRACNQPYLEFEMDDLFDEKL